MPLPAFENRSNAPVNWTKLIISTVWGLVMFALALLKMSLPDPLQFDEANKLPTTILTQAVLFEVGSQSLLSSQLPSKDTLESRSIELPHAVRQVRSQPLFYEIPFNIAIGQPETDLGICILRSNSLHGAWLDGTPLRLDPPSKNSPPLRISPVFKRLERVSGQHTLQFLTKSTSETILRISPVWLGDARTISKACNQAEENLRSVEIGICYLVGLLGVLGLLTSVFLKNRLIFFFALITACWAINRVLINSSYFDMEQPTWGAFFAASKILIALPVVLFMLEMLKQLDSKNFGKIVAFFTIGYAALWFTPIDLWQLWMLVFGAACVLLILVIGIRLSRYSMGTTSLANTAIASTLIFGLLANVVDILRAVGKLTWMEASVTPLVVPFLCVGICMLIAENLHKQIVLQKNVSEKLHSELLQQRLQLESQFRKSKIRSQKLAIFEERKRFLREMHDGLGTQLVSASALMRQPQPNQAALAELIDNAIRELRIFLDVLSIAPDENGKPSGYAVNDLLAKLRQHIEPVLRAKNIQLVWDIDTIPDGFLRSDHSRINLLRLLQEALINAIKHAHTPQITITAKMLGTKLVIEVVDLGVGLRGPMRAEAVSAGYGIKNMRKRASLIGAELSIQDGAPGTVVQVMLAPERALEVPLVGNPLP
jgi:signal transduction histidine kinase